MEKINELVFYQKWETGWHSYYTLDKIPFKIDRMPHSYLLEIPKRFLIQFEENKTKNCMRFKTYDEAEKTAQILFRGKGKEIESSLSFL